ncbi:hypothetical protein T440DRAFT_512026 [Plenodomus tracheiphilus IPT5]|uniref:Uncharacterized protein n=1 Tax=Plenodomus tracheiphilus IPT5 TaxID=1408161 RepID=A0A6A7APT0_9PLEO|nr:hypothetical protein T440DRAFT_512026 [Plenodomus tracheiphilus IPT5]
MGVICAAICISCKQMRRRGKVLAYGLSAKAKHPLPLANAPFLLQTTSASRKRSLVLADTFCLSQTLPSLADTLCLSQTLPSLADTLCLSQTLPSSCRQPLPLASAPLFSQTPSASRKRSLLSQTPSASRRRSLRLTDTPCVSQTPSASRKRSLLLADTLCLSQTLSALANAAMTLPSTFVFPSPGEFVDFVVPEATNDIKQNYAQNKLQQRLQHLLSCKPQSKKVPLDPDVETRLDEIMDMNLISGYESWWSNLNQKEQLSGPDQDIVLLVEAFGDKEFAWRFSQYPNIDRLYKQPLDYGKLITFVMRRDRAAKYHIKQDHTSVSKTREDQLGGATQSLDPQSACKGPVNGRVNVVGDLSVVQKAPQRKRPNVGESHEGKRICLASGQRGTPEFNGTMSAKDAISTPISVPNQEPCMSTSPEQSAGVETPAPIGRRSTVHSLMSVPQAPTIEDVSPNFEYLVQTGSAEELMRSDGSALDRHTITHVYHVREDNITQTPGILDDSNPWSDPNYTLDERNCELFDLAPIGVEKLDGTGDSIVTYRLGGIEAIKCIGEDANSVNDGKMCYINMALCELPFETLAETIKQSDMWKSEKPEISTRTSCLTLRFRRRVIDPYCDLDCIVPTKMVPQVQGIQRRDNHAR